MLRERRVSRNTPDMPSDELVLSLYLDTDASSGPWSDKLERLRAVLDACQASVLDKKDRVQFQAARHWAEKFLGEYHPHGKGLALFYAPESGSVWHTQVQMPVRNMARFEKGPYINPLAGLLVDNPRYALVLVDKERGRLIVTQLNEILLSRDVRDFVPKRHKQNEHNQHVDRHHEELVQRHVKHVAQMVEDLKRQDAFDYLVIGGAAEALPKFEQELPQELAKLVKARFTSPMYASDAELLRAATKSLQDEAVRAAAAAVDRPQAA